MDNKKYVDLVNSSEFPENIQVPIDLPFVDDRGVIQNVWLGNSGSITYISSIKGAIRARHKHLNDWHGCFMISGSVEYLEKDDEEKVIHRQVYKAGECFFSKPDVWHQMTFLEDSQMITANGIVKNHENYEKSIIRK